MRYKKVIVAISARYVQVCIVRDTKQSSTSYSQPFAPPPAEDVGGSSASRSVLSPRDGLIAPERGVMSGKRMGTVA